MATEEIHSLLALPCEVQYEGPEEVLADMPIELDVVLALSLSVAVAVNE